MPFLRYAFGVSQIILLVTMFSGLLMADELTPEEKERAPYDRRRVPNRDTPVFKFFPAPEVSGNSEAGEFIEWVSPDESLHWDRRNNVESSQQVDQRLRERLKGCEGAIVKVSHAGVQLPRPRN